MLSYDVMLLHFTSRNMAEPCQMLVFCGIMVKKSSFAFQERAQLSIRRRFKFFMDGKQSDDGSYTDSSGAVVSTAILNWDDGDPDGGNQKCLGGGYDVLAFFDYFCNNNLPNFVILCAM